MFDPRIPTTTVFLAFLAVSTSVVPCGAKECNEEAIHECASWPYDDCVSRCEYMRTKLDCVKKINGPCENKMDEFNRKFLLENSQDKSKQCDGMAEGECLESLLTDFEKDIPTPDRLENGPEEDRKALCDHAQGKYESTLASLRGMKKKCSMKWAGMELDAAMERVKKTQAACEGFGSNP